MYFANVSIYYTSAPASPKSLFESGFDDPAYHHAAPYTFSFYSKGDFLNKFKQCEHMFNTHEGNIKKYHIQVTSNSVAQVEFDAYTIDFSFRKTDHHSLNYFQLNSKMQCSSTQRTRDFNHWLESIVPLADTPGKFNHIIAVTETKMPCEVIGGFITQCDTNPTDILPMVRQCLYDFDTNAGNRKSFNMIKYMSFLSSDVAFLDFEDTKFVVKEMNFATGELNDWNDDIS